jgi:hypothetical protein
VLQAKSASDSHSGIDPITLSIRFGIWETGTFDRNQMGRVFYVLGHSWIGGNPLL